MLIEQCLLHQSFNELSPALMSPTIPDDARRQREGRV
jgi:hypothetical protein